MNKLKDTTFVNDPQKAPSIFHYLMQVKVGMDKKHNMWEIGEDLVRFENEDKLRIWREDD
jgi:hypothetical protein